jgi:eukaryotic-like serine/threonine-protein kinase
MLDVRQLHRHMDREALILSNRISLVFDTLEQLRRLTLLLLRHRTCDHRAIEAWLEQDGFRADESGFIRSQPQLERICQSVTGPEEVTFAWAETLKHDKVLLSRLHALRHLGSDLRSLRQRIEGVAWMYYQDDRNGCLAYPPLDMAATIPSDFDWHTYHPFLSTGPAVNPERTIRWTPPNIDYGGEGLIITASIPIYLDDDFQGLWSIDIPVRALLRNNFQQTPAESQACFISDAEGNLLLHPVLEAEIDRDKGAIRHKTLAHIGGEFERLEIADLLRRGSGELTLADASGTQLFCIFQVVEAIGWVLFSACPIDATIDFIGNGPTVTAEPPLAAVPRNAESIEPMFSAFADALQGTVLDGKYRLDNLLGIGGFGVVYRSVQLGLNRPVAVKVLQPVMDKNPESHVRRFHREGVSACRVQHPNAVAVLDFGVSPHGLPYLVMELLEGHSLAAELQRCGRFNVDRALSVGAVIARVLAAAHAVGIIHRDIKPDNVFLHQGDPGEVVKVLDFGLAKLVHGQEPLSGTVTTTGHVLGTPLYMSPEQLQARPLEGRTDVYSLGILLHELLAGTAPFRGKGDSPWMVIMQHINEPPPPLQSAVSDIPVAVDRFVGRMLSKTPAERPHALEVAEVLEGILSNVKAA